MHHGICVDQERITSRSLRIAREMQTPKSRLRPQRSSQGPYRHHAGHEALEDRRMLAIQSVAPTIELLGNELSVGSQSDDVDGLLVRFRDDAFCERARIHANR